MLRKLLTYAAPLPGVLLAVYGGFLIKSNLLTNGSTGGILAGAVFAICGAAVVYGLNALLLRGREQPTAAPSGANYADVDSLLRRLKPHAKSEAAKERLASLRHAFADEEYGEEAAE